MGSIHIAWVSQLNRLGSLAAKSVQSPALPLQGIDNVHSSDSLPLGMLSVRDGVADDILQEHLHTYQLRVHTTATTYKMFTFKTPLVSS